MVVGVNNVRAELGAVVATTTVVVVVVDVVVVGTGIATATVMGEPEIAVCVLPAVSAMENELALVNVTLADCPAVSPLATVTVHVEDVVCVTEAREPFVTVKSTPAMADSVEQLMGSFPVTV